ncbi:MAG: MFS transporter, partial [Chloroflexi bacterium]|nr:MFS transporter [Chloroflexota bacterium]
RFDRRQVIVVTSVVGAATAALLAILTLSGRIDFETVVILALVAGAANAVEMPARQSLVVELAGRERLANAIALNSLLFNGARVIGPAIAGLIVALFGAGWAFAVNAASFVPVVAGLLLIGPPLLERARVAARGAIGELIAYLRLETRATGLLLLLGLQTTFASGHLVIGPAVARQLGVGAEGLGFLLAATGLGAVFAGLRLAAFPDTGLRWRVLVLSGLVLAASLGAVGLTPGFALTLGAFALAGVGMVTFNASSNTIIQSLVAERLRGRVMSLYTIVQLGLIPAGSLLMGALADVVGAAQALGIGGAMWGASVVAAFGLSRGLRRL